MLLAHGVWIDAQRRVYYTVAVVGHGAMIIVLAVLVRRWTSVHLGLVGVLLGELVAVRLLGIGGVMPRLVVGTVRSEASVVERGAIPLLSSVVADRKQVLIGRVCIHGLALECEMLSRHVTRGHGGDG